MNLLKKIALVAMTVLMGTGVAVGVGNTLETVVPSDQIAHAADEDYCNKLLVLKPNSNWKVDGARFAAYFFGNGETWVSMTKFDDNTYFCASPSKKYPSVIFCRMNPSATANNWNNKWNQTGDLTISTGSNNCYTVKDGTWDKGGGTWSTFGNPISRITVDGASTYATYAKSTVTNAIEASITKNLTKGAKIQFFRGSTEVLSSGPKNDLGSGSVSNIDKNSQIINDVTSGTICYNFDTKSVWVSGHDFSKDGLYDTTTVYVGIGGENDKHNWDNGVYLYSWNGATYPNGTHPGKKQSGGTTGLEFYEGYGLMKIELRTDYTSNYLLTNGFTGSSESKTNDFKLDTTKKGPLYIKTTDLKDSTGDNGDACKAAEFSYNLNETRLATEDDSICSISITDMEKFVSDYNNLSSKSKELVDNAKITTINFQNQKGNKNEAEYTIKEIMAVLTRKVEESKNQGSLGALILPTGNNNSALIFLIVFALIGISVITSIAIHKKRVNY